MIITDIFMLDMDGIELIQRLQKSHPGTPVFALSGGTPLANSKEYLAFVNVFWRQ